MNRILLATAEIITQKGIDRAGINAIADQANVNKVLIYRYFSGWNGVIEALYEQILSAINTQIAVKELNAEVSNQSIVGKTYAVHYYRELRSNIAFQRLLLWQMDHQQAELAQRLTILQDEAIKQVGSSDTIQAGVLQLLLAGIRHLVLVETQQISNDPTDLTEQVIHRIYHPLR